MGGVSDELYGWDVSFFEGSHERRRSPSARRCCCRIDWLSLDGHKIPIDDWPEVLFWHICHQVPSGRGLGHPCL